MFSFFKNKKLLRIFVFILVFNVVYPISQAINSNFLPNAYADVVFSQTFTGGSEASATNKSAWTTFVGSLSGTYTRLTFSSSNGNSITIDHASYITEIGNYLYAGTTTTKTWTISTSPAIYAQIGMCGSGIELSIGSAATTCACQSSGIYTIRPYINPSNPNWGGANGATCNAPTQTITITFGSSSNSVLFNSNGGTGSPSVSSVTQSSPGTSITLATVGTLARTGYTFSGWNTAANGSGTTYAAGATYTPASSITLYAQWNSTISYDSNTATSGTAPPATTAKSSAAVTTLATNSGSLAKTGYTFGGWNTAANGSGTSYAAGLTTYSSPGNTTLYAQWNSVITYLANGSTSGSVPSASSLYGTSGTLATNSGSLAKTGFTAGGWNTNETGTGTSYAFGGSYTPNGNRSLYAQWNSVITYNGNSNTGGTAPGSTTITGTAGSLATNSGSMTLTGKVFAGWNTNAAGTGTWYAAGSTYPNSGNITLYAQWVNQLAISGSSTINVGQGTAYRSDTYTATAGLDTKTVTYTLSPANSGITLETSTVGSTTYAYIRVASTVLAGTFIDTLTATDRMGTSVSLPVTITVSSPLRWDTANSTTLVTTTGKSSSLRLNTVNGFSGKSFTMVAGSQPISAGITLDTSTASAGYVTLNVASSVLAGTYIESITAVDSSGTRVTTLVTVTVNSFITITRDGTTVAAPYSSLSFNGTNQYVTYAPTSAFQLGSTYTLEWWQYQTDSTLYPRIFSMTGSYFGVSLESNIFYYWNGNARNMGGLGTTRSNSWTHFALVSNAGSVLVYQNGLALSSTAQNLGSIGSAQAPGNVNFCIASQCGSANTFFGGQITNFIISKRADYSGTSTTTANFTPSKSMRIDSTTVIALTSLNGAATFTDLSSNGFTPTSYNGSPTGSTNFPGGASSVVTELVTTQGFPVTSSSFVASGGTGNKTFTMTSNNAGVTLNASPNNATVTIGSSVTATNSTTAKIAYETLTATDSVTSSISAPLKLTINPPIALSATALNPTTSAQVVLYDTITASYGTGTKTFSYIGSPISSAITFTSPAPNTLLMTVGKTATAGVYYETITATDTVGDTETVVITLTVNPGLTLASNTGSNVLSTTAGTAASLRVNANNGSGTKTFTLTHMGNSNAGITLDNSNAVSGYTLLSVASTVPAGTYSESITVTDAQGSKAQILISVTVNPAATLSYNGATSGAINLATTAGTSIRSSVFTATGGTGARTLSLSGLNSGISIDTSTADLAYITLGTGLTSTNATTARTINETITVTDALGAKTNRAVTITVNPTIAMTVAASSITTTSGIAITDTVTVTASTGTGTKTFSLSPAISGISFTNNVVNQAVITVGTNVGPGTYSITVSATDSVGATGQVAISLTVNIGPTISGPSIVSMTTGFAYNTPYFTISNGTGSSSVAVTGTMTSSYISIETSTATSFRIKITGSPTANGSNPAYYYETLTVTDSLGAKGYAYVTVIVYPVVTISGTATINKTYGTSVEQIYQATGSPNFVFWGQTVCATKKSIITGDGTNGTVSGSSYTIEEITGSGTCSWNVPAGVTSATYELVGGGGGGGGGGYQISSWGNGGGGGGGGSGAIATGTASLTPLSSQSITVGVGGSGGAGGFNGGGWNGVNGTSGGATSAFGVTASGGYFGCGAGWVSYGANGSGCIYVNNSSWIDGTSGFGGNSGNGNSGGSKSTTVGNGGGGGASASSNGSTPTGTVGASGGAGTSSTILSKTVASGGTGGNGSVSTPVNPTPATPNTGNGGNGGSGSFNGGFTSNGANGGSGSVVLRYLTPSETATSTFISLNAITTASSPASIKMTIPDLVPAGNNIQQTISVTDSLGQSSSIVVTINIAKATPTLNLSIPGGGSTVTYGTPVVLTATATTAGTFNFRIGSTSITSCGAKTTSNGLATCSWTPAAAGSTSVTAEFSPNDTSNFNIPTAASLALSVSKADSITVTFSNQEVTYTGSAVSVDTRFTVTGLLNGDSITAISKKFIGAANGASAGSYNSSTAPTNAGIYALNAETTTSFASISSVGGTVSSANYLGVNFVGGAITVNRASNPVSFNYGTANTVTYSPSGLETVTVTSSGDGVRSFTSNTASTCSINSSSGQITKIAAGICTVTLDVAQGTNYLANSFVAAVTIDKAPRTLTLARNLASLKYGETATVTYSVSAETTTGTISFSLGSSTLCDYDEDLGILTAKAGTSSCTLSASISEGTNYLASNSSGLIFNLSPANAPIVTVVSPMNIDYLQDSSDPTIIVTGLIFSDTATATGATFNYLATGTYPYNSSTKPTNANVYTITPSALVLSVGNLANYQTPQYVAASWTINRITQSAIQVLTALQESITVPIDISISGGTINGSTSLNIISGGTAAGCSAVGMNLRALSTGTCLFTVTMAGNQNYLPVTSDTATIVITNFIQTVFNFDSFSSSGSAIAINSAVPLTKDNPQCSSACVPTISSISPTTFQSGDLVVITGNDFATATGVIFNRTTTVTDFQIDSNTQITVKVPSGLTAPGISASASISVQSPGKISFRFSGLTVTG